MLHLLPLPRRIRYDDGAFCLHMECRIVLEQLPDAMARTAAQQLQMEIRRACGVEIPILPGRSRRGDVALCIAAELPAQGYTLSIREDGVRVAGGSPAGLLHGVQTLRQVWQQCGWTLPEMEVEDAPAFAERGFYHDVTRGRVPNRAWLHTLADACCHYKLNQLQLYVEHTYLFRDLTELWRAGVTPLTAEDILELDAYCAERGIELVPSLSSFGHLYELLRTRSFGHLCEMENAGDGPSTMPGRMAHHTINPSAPGALELICGMLTEFSALFRSRRFNICADETFDLGRGRSRAAMEQVGEGAYYMGFLRQLCDHIRSLGKQPMFWGDVVAAHPETLQQLPEGVICLNWGYSPAVTDDTARKLARAGAVQYVCPGVQGWNRLIPHLDDSYENIRRMAAYGRAYGALGLLNTDWGDYGHINDPRLSLPGMIMGACAGWSAELMEKDALMAGISTLLMGDRSGRAASWLAELSRGSLYSWWDLVGYKEYIQGQRGRYLVEKLPAITDEQLQQADARLARAMTGLRHACREMDADHRPMLAVWLLAGEGVSVWNHVSAAAAASRRDPALAERLERWLLRYERGWRQVSQESELWRMRDVAAWYATLLRG